MATVAAPNRQNWKAISVYEGAGDETIRLAEVDLASIVMPGFQRDRKEHHIAKIAAEYDGTAYAFPVCATFRNEVLAIDGQQRLVALEKNEVDTATVLLIDGIRTEARLAQVFLLINRDRKLLNAFEKYIGAVAAKDRGTLDCQRVVGDAGLEIGKSAAANGKIPAGAVAKIHAWGGTDLLQRVLQVRVCAWDGSREANEAATLLGLAQFLRRYWDKINDEHLIVVLRKNHPSYILQATDKRRGSARVSYSDYLREQYNRGRRGKGGRL